MLLPAISVAYSTMCIRPCALYDRASWSIFTKIGTDVWTPKSKNEFVGRQHENPCKY